MGELLDKSLIEVGVDADSWEDIISYGSELLLKKGNVKEGYKEKVIERERQFPTGLAGKHMGIAIPHTSADYTLKPSVCVLIPQKPIAFHAMASEADTIDASIVIQLAAAGDAEKGGPNSAGRSAAGPSDGGKGQTGSDPPALAHFGR